MIMKKILIIIVIILIHGTSFNLYADQLKQVLESKYKAAKPSRALKTAAVELDLTTINTYVVVIKSGIPVERASFYIDWGQYDYRASKVKKDKLKTRRGKIYAFLQPGDIMAVASTRKFGRRFNIRLISPKIYKPLNRLKDKRHSRVTCSVGFKVSKNPQKALQQIGGWLKPFSNFNDAQNYAQGLKRAQKSVYHSM